MKFFAMDKKKFNRVVIITLLPVVLWPLLMMDISRPMGSAERLLVLLMPVFAIASTYYAHYTYKERPEVAWTLVALCWLSYMAFLVLVYVA